MTAAAATTARTELAHTLIAIRRAARLSVHEFADQLDMWAQAPFRWERADAIPRVKVLRKICQTFPAEVDQVGYDFARLYDLREAARQERGTRQ